MNFNLSKSNTSAVVRLKPWTINRVKFNGVDLRGGTAQSGNQWEAIQFKFEGEDGIFEHMVFCPNAQDGDKRGGNEGTLPSQLETLVHTLAHVLGVLNPAGFDKLKGIELDLPKDFGKLYQYVKKVLDPKIGTETNLKLIANNKGYASVPYFININRDTKESYISNNWLGENLAFTPSEIKLKEKQANAKPTNMSTAVTESNDVIADDDNIDLDL